MTVRVVREEDPAEERPTLKLVAPEPTGETPVSPGVTPPLQQPSVAIAEPPSVERRQAVTLHALGVMVALANVVSVRFILVLALVMAAVMATFGEHTILSLINAGVFDILVVVPIVALALRKG